MITTIKDAAYYDRILGSLNSRFDPPPVEPTKIPADEQRKGLVASQAAKERHALGAQSLSVICHKTGNEHRWKKSGLDRHGNPRKKCIDCLTTRRNRGA